MAPAPIRYFDRYDGTTKTEKVFGELWLRLAYGNPVGRLAVWLAIRRSLFSRYYGWRMRLLASSYRIYDFVQEYGVDISEFAKSPYEFKTFNEFFTRALKPESRPIAPGAGVAVMPADGRHLAFPDVDRAEGFYVKGEKFTVAALLGDAKLAEKYAGGSMLISRLCPSDYHRFHFPVSGIPAEPRAAEGTLFSVSPIALRRNINFLVRNKRLVTVIETPEFGTVTMVEVGATNVGTIIETFVPGRAAVKGEEKGMFSFGGSCVVTLFEARRILLDEDIVRQSEKCLETYARMGDHLGRAGR
ncbi:MAG TPA: archaetidylserine decarboxylase [Opitutaceae bacterium]